MRPLETESGLPPTSKAPYRDNVYAGWVLLIVLLAGVALLQYVIRSPLGGTPNAAHAQPGGARAAFDLSNATVDVAEIRGGGPPKDGIPALTQPKYVRADDAGFLKDQDRVIGVVVDQSARAYPLNILNYHEVVNDRIGEIPFAVTYCPLCDSAAVLDRRTPLGEREFGVSGLLYNSNVLIYDRRGQPESLWSQVKAAGVTGPAANKPLRALPVELVTWAEWRQRHPETLVLSQQTGHRRNYARNPYEQYFQHDRLMFPVKPQSDALPAKARVIGVWTDTVSRAFPEQAFREGQNEWTDQLNGARVTLAYNPETRSLRVVQADEGVQWMYSFWFAWYSLRPDTEVFQPPE